MSTTVDPHSEAMQRGAGRLMPEFECRHGRLNGDPSAPCGCWKGEVVSDKGQIQIARDIPSTLDAVEMLKDEIRRMRRKVRAADQRALYWRRKVEQR